MATFRRKKEGDTKQQKLKEKLIKLSHNKDVEQQQYQQHGHNK